MVLLPCGACCSCSVESAKALWEDLQRRRHRVTITGTQPGQDAATVSQGFSSDAVAGQVVTDSWSWTFYRKCESLIGLHDLALDFAGGPIVGGFLDSGTVWNDAAGAGTVKFSASAVGFTIRLFLRVDAAAFPAATNEWPGSRCPVIANLVVTAESYSAQYFGTLAGAPLSTVTQTIPAGSVGAGETRTMRTASPPFSSYMGAGLAGPFHDPARPGVTSRFDGVWDNDTLKPAATAWVETALVRSNRPGSAGRVDNGPAGIRIPFPAFVTAFTYTRRQWEAGNAGGLWVAGLRPGELSYKGAAFPYVGPAFEAIYTPASKHLSGDQATPALTFEVDSLP